MFENIIISSHFKEILIMKSVEISVNELPYFFQNYLCAYVGAIYYSQIFQNVNSIKEYEVNTYANIHQERIFISTFSSIDST